jgi:hypothetical protein
MPAVFVKSASLTMPPEHAATLRALSQNRYIPNVGAADLPDKIGSGAGNSFQGTVSVTLTILYRHSRRCDEAGMVIVPEQAQVAAMKDQLEKNGYTVVKIVTGTVAEPIPLV